MVARTWSASPHRPVGYPACRTHTSRVFSYSRLSSVVWDMYIWANEQSPWCQLQGKLNRFPASTGWARLLLPCSHMGSCKYRSVLRVRIQSCIPLASSVPFMCATSLASFSCLLLLTLLLLPAFFGLAFCFGEENLLCWNWNLRTYKLCFDQAILLWKRFIRLSPIVLVKSIK